MKFATTAAARPAWPAVPTARRDTVRLAFDRASVRRTDQDGHLHIEVSPISKACVSEYWGSEIPDGERLGLDPGRLYRLLRDPAELAKAAPTFRGKPLLVNHRPVSADLHPHKAVVGSIGQDVRWEPPYLVASMTVWDSAAIDGIASGAQRQLSAAYRYRALAEPSVYQGVHYDLRMVDIVGNHCALVEVGRAGPDVVVNDAALKPKGKFMPARPPGLTRDDETELDDGVVSQLKAYLQAVLSPDAMIDIEKILAGQSVPNPEMAGDGAARQVARRFVADQQAREEAAFVQRFPDAARLRR